MRARGMLYATARAMGTARAMSRGPMALLRRSLRISLYRLTGVLVGGLMKALTGRR